MRTTCVGCPCLEKKDGKDFCYWYQGWTGGKPCGRDFQVKPKFTQEEAEATFMLPKRRHGKKR